MLSAMVFSPAGGQIIRRTGIYRAFPIIGTALLSVGTHGIGAATGGSTFVRTPGRSLGVAFLNTPTC